MTMKISGIIILVITIINTVNLIIKNPDFGSVMALIGLLCFAINGILYAFFS